MTAWGNGSGRLPQGWERLAGDVPSVLSRRFVRGARRRTILLTLFLLAVSTALVICWARSTINSIAAAEQEQRTRALLKAQAILAELNRLNHTELEAIECPDLQPLSSPSGEFRHWVEGYKGELGAL